MAAPAKKILEEALPPSKGKKTEPSPYQVKKALYDEAKQIKGRQELVQKRLEKMVEHRSEVSEAVFFKVKTDYETQLDEVSGDFRDQCARIEEELEEIYQAKSEQELSLKEHEDVLEEAKFRHKLGEFSNKKFQEVESKEKRDIDKYQDLLKTIGSSIEQYEGILGHSYEPKGLKASEAAPAKEEALEELALASDQVESTNPSIDAPEAKVAKKTAAKPKLKKKESVKDELDAFLESEEDYFSGQEEELEIPEVSEPSELAAEAKADLSHIPEVSRTEPDNSISNILRDIPMEEEEAQGPKPSQTETKVEDQPDFEAAKADMPEASLLLLEGNFDEEEYILEENTSIGRSPSNDMVLKESKISRQHATINYRDGHYVVVDLKSSNGVLINNKKVEEVTLQDGDEVRIGSFKFQFNLL